MGACKSCWWQEGGRCYGEPVTRDKDGRSAKFADCQCGNFVTKREMLEQVIPGDKLVILSEREQPPKGGE